VFEAPAVDPAVGHVYFGLGGYEGIDGATTPFLRACDWSTLNDAWPTVLGADGVSRYSTTGMYTSNDSGLSSPVVVNDLVLVATTKPALYAFASANGIFVWTFPGFPSGAGVTYCVGPAISGNSVVVGTENQLLIYG
jgi:outer membrane protein assembly factor BamB